MDTNEHDKRDSSCHSVLGVYGFYLTFTYQKYDEICQMTKIEKQSFRSPLPAFRLLKGANTLQLEKPIKQEYGGGYRIFLFDDLELYEGVEDEEKFFSAQERQSIVLHLLYSIRLNEPKVIHGVQFKVDQSLSSSRSIVRFFVKIASLQFNAV